MAAVVREIKQDRTTKIIAGCILGRWLRETAGFEGPHQPCQHHRRTHRNGEHLLVRDSISSRRRVPDLRNARTSLLDAGSNLSHPHETREISESNRSPCEVGIDIGGVSYISFYILYLVNCDSKVESSAPPAAEKKQAAAIVSYMQPGQQLNMVRSTAK